jgi:hypothetical protein
MRFSESRLRGGFLVFGPCRHRVATRNYLLGPTGESLVRQKRDSSAFGLKTFCVDEMQQSAGGAIEQMTEWRNRDEQTICTVSLDLRN